MQLILQAIFPILLALLLGYALGLLLPRRHTRHCARLLTPLIWLLLFYCGKGFGDVLSNGSLLGKTLGTALVFAFLTTALPWGLIVLCMRQPRASGNATGRNAAKNAVSPCAARLPDCIEHGGNGAAAAGLHLGWMDAISTTQLLYLLIVLVGIDLAELKLNSSWRARR
jgi:uncharacterized membrane protein YbjE (DUF340 family)